MKKTHYLLIAVLIMSILSACTEKAEDTENAKSKERETPVEVVEVTKGDLVVEQTVYGRTAPQTTTPIMLQAAGEIDSIEKEEGSDVKKDDSLFVVKTPYGKQTIKAPKDGTLVNFSKKEGDTVSTEEPVALIADLETLNISFSVTEKDRQHFKKEQTLQATYNGKKEKITITSIGTLPGDTGLYPIEATIDNKDNKIVSGTILKITVPTKRIKNTLKIPTEALVEEAGETFIYIAKDNKAEKVNVTIKETQSDYTAVEGKLKEKDQVIVNGQLTLTDGNKIKVVEESGE